MRLEPLFLTPKPPADGGRQSEDGGKTRLPRWTRQEILLLIQGKRVVENRVRGSGSGQTEPKWTSVASFCEKHGMNRSPVQCRKRWSNLAGDFRKIKEWESNCKEETESFWVMRNDLRRERKLPGFFDKDIYDTLDGSGGGDMEEEDAGLVLGLGAPKEEDDVAEDAEEDSCRAEFLNPMPVSTPIAVVERQPHQPFSQESPARAVAGSGNKREKLPTRQAEVRTSQEGRKRKRDGTDEEEGTMNLQHQLVEALERNGKLLSLQLEAQNTNLQQDREQRDDQMSSFITVLSKLADSLGKIADKL